MMMVVYKIKLSIEQSIRMERHIEQTKQNKKVTNTYSKIKFKNDYKNSSSTLSLNEEREQAMKRTKIIESKMKIANVCQKICF